MYDVERDKKAAAAKPALQTKPAAGTRAEAGAGDAVQAIAAPAPVAAKGIATVREALIAHFRDVFVPSSSFQETFGVDVAMALAKQGSTVYITGRTTTSSENSPGSMDQAAAEIQTAAANASAAQHSAPGPR